MSFVKLAGVVLIYTKIAIICHRRSQKTRPGSMINPVVPTSITPLRESPPTRRELASDTLAHVLVRTAARIAAHFPQTLLCSQTLLLQSLPDTSLG